MIQREPRIYRPKFCWDGNRYFGVGDQLTDAADDQDLRGDYGAMAGWVRPHHAPGDGVMHSYYRISPINGVANTYIVLIKNHLNQLGIGINNGGGAQTAGVIANAGNFAQNVWHHIGGVWQQENLRFFLDGTLAAAVAGPINVGDAAYPAGSQIVRGSWPLFAANSIADLAWLKIWREVPPDEEMIWLFNNERGSFGV